MSTSSEQPDHRPAPPSSDSAWGLMTIAYQQAWALCAAYLSLGLVAELLRRAGTRLGISAQAFLDSLPIFALHSSGLIEPYLRAVALGGLTPFWNRILLSSITVGVILLQATLTGLALAGFIRLLRGRRR